MAKVFISYAHEDDHIAKTITKALQQRKHSVFLDQQSIRVGAHWQEDIKKNLQHADVFLALVTEHSDKSYYFNAEITWAISYIKNSHADKLILPIVLDRKTLDDKELGAFQALFGDVEGLGLLIAEIDNAISKFEGFRLAQEEIRQAKSKVLEQKSSDYIKEALDNLQSREKRSRTLSTVWHVLGFLSLLASVGIVFYLWFKSEKDLANTSIEPTRLIFDTIKGVTGIVLMLGLGRYSFMLAKGHNTEALKNADRIHAISFGKFYLQVFGDQVSSDELKEVFQHWNTSGATDFSHLDVDKIDSRFADLFGKFADKMDLRSKE